MNESLAGKKQKKNEINLKTRKKKGNLTFRSNNIVKVKTRIIY